VVFAQTKQSHLKLKIINHFNTMGILGYKVDGAADTVNKIMSKINSRMDKGDLSLLQALAASSDGKDMLGPMLATAGNWAKFATAASGIVAVTTTLIGADAMTHCKKVAREMSKSLETLCKSVEVSTNLKHEKDFPKWVYDFVANESSGRDLININNKSLKRRIKELDCSLPDSSHSEGRDVAHYYFVYHPATDWHAPFSNMVRKEPLPGFVGATDSLDALGLYLIKFRKVVGPEAVIHILMPSAHMYVIKEEITVPAALQPLRITGQKHYSGNPYVHATIQGMDEADLRDIGLLVKPNKLGAGDVAGAVAGGLGAGIAGGAVACIGVGFLAVAGCTVAGPVFLASAAADLVIGGGMIAGLLGGGSAAGAVTGVAITEKAKWKGTGCDGKEKVRKT
jgi:hypothetical protein